jgi:hypothetical protein
MPVRRPLKVTAIFFYPDYTVGFGLLPNLLTFSFEKRSRAPLSAKNHKATAGRELHPALKIIININLV